jgi:hypothetical protein
MLGPAAAALLLLLVVVLVVAWGLLVGAVQQQV